MRKVFLLILCTLFIVPLFCACDVKQDHSMVKSERKLGKYIEATTNKSSGQIDLSEGPSLNYNYHLGPQKLDFDFKIVDPY